MVEVNNTTRRKNIKKSMVDYIHNKEKKEEKKK